MFCRPHRLACYTRFVALAVCDLSVFGSPATTIVRHSFGDIQFKNEKYVSATAITIGDASRSRI